MGILFQSSRRSPLQGVKESYLYIPSGPNAANAPKLLKTDLGLGVELSLPPIQ